MATHSVELYWFMAVLCGVLALAALLAAFSRLRRDRFIADTPAVRMRSAAQGYVRVEGIARSPAGDIMRSPLMHRPCVWWDYRVEAAERNAKGEKVYRTIESGTSVTPFVLDDGDGQCLVGPVGAEVTVTSSERWSGDSRRFHERLIAPGSPLSVLGELRSHTEFGAVDQKSQDILCQWKRDQGALVRRFDRNHDGVIDQQEWETARAAAHTEAEATVLHSPIERVGVIGQTTHNEPFLIAPLTRNQLIRRERRNAFLLLLASLLLLSLGLHALSKAQTHDLPHSEVTALRINI